MVTFEKIKNNEEINTLIKASGDVLNAMNYTEHGFRHANYVSRTAYKILHSLDHDIKTQELARIAGYLHDVGNAVNRNNHGITAGALIYPILKQAGMPYDDICTLIAAVGNHEEEIGAIVNPVSAALVIADKSDAHRTRVKPDAYDKNDIHDRVNYSIKKNIVEIDGKNKVIASRYYMDDSSSVMEYLTIYLSRMSMSERAANYLGCSFRLYINDLLVNSPVTVSGLGLSDDALTGAFTDI